MSLFDFSIEFLGSNDFTGVSFAEAPIGKFPGWDSAKITKKADRRLFEGSCGSKPSGRGEIEPVRDRVIAEMDKTAGGRNNIGGVALVGSSNGCAVALSVAIALQRRITYIALLDLPMFPFGRNPPVPGYGSLTPDQNPKTSGGMSGSGLVPGSSIFTKYFKIKPVSGDVPFLNAPQVVDARRKRNFYQTDGNWAKVKALTFNWIWFSDMMGSEVHGTIENDNWDNVLVDASKAVIQDDDGFHGEPERVHFNTARADAIRELAQFDP